jgi:phage gpG-like protein
MAKSNKFDLKQVEKKARKAMEAAIVDVGNTAKVFFVDSFRKQGWDDQSVQKWKKRQLSERKGRGSKKSAKAARTVRSVKAGRAILVKTGDLRRSIKRNPANRAALSIKISTDLPYAKIHNDGGNVVQYVKPHRRFVDQGDTMGTGVFNIKSRKEKQAKVKVKQDVKGFSRKVRMPKRQFMGDSYNLNEKVKAVIVKHNILINAVSNI